MVMNPMSSFQDFTGAPSSQHEQARVSCWSRLWLTRRRGRWLQTRRWGRRPMGWPSDSGACCVQACPPRAVTIHALLHQKHPHEATILGGPTPEHHSDPMGLSGPLLWVRAAAQSGRTQNLGSERDLPATVQANLGTGHSLQHPRSPRAWPSPADCTRDPHARSQVRSSGTGEWPSVVQGGQERSFSRKAAMAPEAGYRPGQKTEGFLTGRGGKHPPSSEVSQPPAFTGTCASSPNVGSFQSKSFTVTVWFIF